MLNVNRYFFEYYLVFIYNIGLLASSWCWTHVKAILKISPLAFVLPNCPKFSYRLSTNGITPLSLGLQPVDVLHWHGGEGWDGSSFCRKDGLASHLQSTVEEMLEFLWAELSKKTWFCHNSVLACCSNRQFKKRLLAKIICLARNPQSRGVCLIS